MADKTTEQPKAQAKEPAVKVTVPPVWTAFMWQVYIDGATEYNTKVLAAKGNLINTFSMFHGAVALIKKGIVHVTGPDSVTQWLDGRPIDDAPVQIIGGLADLIGRPIEASMNTPLEVYLSRLSASTTTPAATTVLAP